MLDTTLDLLTQAASNSLYVFCFCNLIILMIAMGSKPGTFFDQESEIPVPMVTSTDTVVYINTNDKQVDDDDDDDDDDATCEQQQEGTMINSPIVVFSQLSNMAKKELAIATGDAKCEQEEEGTMINSPIVAFSQVSNIAKKDLATATDDNGSSCIDDHNDDDSSCIDDDSKECDNDDELRRRVEEFIEKVNRGWRAELLRTQMKHGLKTCIMNQN